jgi:protease-4
MAGWLSLIVVGTLGAQARAGTPGTERPVLPPMSTVAEDGALSIWSNPANLAFDSDPSFGLIYALPYGGDPQVESQSTVAAAANLGPLGTGFAYKGGAGEPGWWTLSSSLGIKAGRTVAMGAHFGWQIPDGEANNFVTVDLGMGYRPTHWLGVSAVAQNVGGPASHMGVEEMFIGGLALRPFEERLVLGGEYWFNGDPAAEVPGYLQGTLKAEPIRGLGIRGSLNQLGQFGLGIELAFGGSNLGAHTHMGGLGASTAMGTLTSRDSDHSLLDTGKVVPEFVLDQRFPYQPQRSIFGQSGESYLHLLQRMDAAARDSSVKAMVLHLDRAPFSFAQIEEILAVMDLAQEQDKQIIAYLGEDSGNAATMIASGADLILMHPAQQLGLVGLSAELQYFRGTLDLIGVEPQFSRRSEYKSAAESMTHTGASAASREQMDALLDDVSSQLVQRIADGRRLDPEEVRKLIDKGPFTAAEAIEAGLIDGTAFPDEIAKRVKAHMEHGIALTPEWQLKDRNQGWRAPKEIAIILVDGVITTGQSRSPGFFGGGRTAGSETILRQLEAAEEDGSIEAVVLRVDSPGGSAYASDEIWRAVEQFQRSGKPVVVSMGGVAASGGYYVSSGADAIYASPSTITGSIGVIGGKFSMEGLYDKLGIRYELYNRGRNAGMFSSSKPFDDTEFAAFDKMIGDIYRQFTNKVAVGRAMEQEEVEKVARGRVWSGTDARDRKLVDELGGFGAAVARARVEAGIAPGTRVDLVTLHDRGSPDGSMTRAGVRALGQVLLPPSLQSEGKNNPLAAFEHWQRLQGERVWALMPYQLEIK